MTDNSEYELNRFAVCTNLKETEVENLLLTFEVSHLNSSTKNLEQLVNNLLPENTFLKALASSSMTLENSYQDHHGVMMAEISSILNNLLVNNSIPRNQEISELLHCTQWTNLSQTDS